MKEKEMQQQQEPTRLGQQQTSETKPEAGKVTVMFGIHKLNDLQIAGKTVGEVRKTLSSPLNIPSEAANLVNGNPVDVNYVLQPNETLEFVKLAGEKG